MTPTQISSIISLSISELDITIRGMPFELTGPNRIPTPSTDHVLRNTTRSPSLIKGRGLAKQP